MKFQIDGNPDCGELVAHLSAGETIWAEAGAMSRMSSHLDFHSRLMGGLLRTGIRRVVGGESLFVGEYSALAEPGFVAFSPAIPGSVLQRTLAEGQSFILTASSFLACTPDVVLKTRFGGFRSLFSGEGAFFLECQGPGELFFNAYGGVVERELKGGELIVDTGHVVAWEPGLSYTISGMGGLKQTLFSGEGLVLRLKGSGKVYLQTRHLGGLVRWIRPFLPA